MGSTELPNKKSPLADRCYILTRPEGSGGDLAHALEEAGAEVACFRVIRFEDGAPEGLAGIAELLGESGEGAEWIILPSPRAVRCFFEAIKNDKSGLIMAESAKIAVIGEASRKVCEEVGRPADFVPSEANGATLADELPLDESMRVVVAGAEKTRPELIEGLRQRGAEVKHVALYRTVSNAREVVAMAEFAVGNRVDGCIVYSPSAVEAIVRNWPGDAKVQLPDLAWFAVGPTTNSALDANGLKSAAVADRPVAQAVLRSIVSIYGQDDRAVKAEQQQ